MFSECGNPRCSGEAMRAITDLRAAAKTEGFEIRDVCPDGNCMFAAVVDQLLVRSYVHAWL